MNRSWYYRYIEERLNLLSYRIHHSGKINLLDLHIHSEAFFAELVNHLLKYHLINMNAIRQNVAGIDLVDRERQIVAQVSATCTKQKINKSLAKDAMEEFRGYRFKFIAIAGDATSLRTQTYDNPHGMIFSPQDDIYDITSLSKLVLNMNIKDQMALYEFVRDELGEPIPVTKVDTNLATIVDILSREDLSEMLESPEINVFEIQRKIEYNDLLAVQPTIDDYKVYYRRLNEQYQEFDRQGANKSKSVLLKIRKQYIELSAQKEDSQELFLSLIDQLIDIVQNSRNYVEIPFEELEMCVSIIVVDAFIKCAIFENPEGYQYVIAR
ncbi:MAG: SMEK domain-containing protein [Lachnospiraceae bacterium]|nr:SMEK domain-containing protein [Lachnospiraceae bacterium]